MKKLSMGEGFAISMFDYQRVSYVFFKTCHGLLLRVSVPKSEMTSSPPIPVLKKNLFWMYAQTGSSLKMVCIYVHIYIYICIYIYIYMYPLNSNASKTSCSKGIQQLQFQPLAFLMLFRIRAQRLGQGLWFYTATIC